MMTRTDTKQLLKVHHFFLTSVSPWPLVSSMNSFNLLFSLLIFFKFEGSYCFLLNLLNLSITSFLWWFNYSSEFNLEGKNSKTLETGLKFAMLLFISSEVFFFFSFFWSYFHFYLSPAMEIGLSWPPFLIVPFNCSQVPLINTLVLMTSGVTVTLSHFYLLEEKKFKAMVMLTMTVVLGLIFTALQAMEYLSSFFSISDSVFGTSFFILTGFHGIHVLIGTMFLLIVLKRSTNLNFTGTECASFEMSSWYWHFVDVVWIFLYFVLYYLNN